MKKGINIWSFPPDTPVKECIRQAKAAGFAGIELAFETSGPLSMQSSPEEWLEIKAFAEEAGIEIAGLAFARYAAYSLSSQHENVREAAKEVIRAHLDAAALLGVECILVVAPRGDADLGPDPENPTPGEIPDYEQAYKLAVEGLCELAPYAEATGVSIGIENVWNGALLSPLEMRHFIEDVGSPCVGAYLDIGNMLKFSHPQQWIRILCKHIKMVHFKDYRTSVGSFDGFVDLLEGDVDFAACMREFGRIGYTGWACAEMWPPYATHPELTVQFTSLAMDKILGL